MILVAAATELDANWERLRAMPSEERNRLLANLQRFDLELTPEQRSSLRELDRRVSELSPDRRARTSKRSCGATTTGSRPARESPGRAGRETAGGTDGTGPQVGSRSGRCPTVTPHRSCAWLEPGELSPFELASAYKIWQALHADQRLESDHGRA